MWLFHFRNTSRNRNPFTSWPGRRLGVSNCECPIGASVACRREQQILMDGAPVCSAENESSLRRENRARPTALHIDLVDLALRRRVEDSALATDPTAGVCTGTTQPPRRPGPFCNPDTGAQAAPRFNGDSVT